MAILSKWILRSYLRYFGSIFGIVLLTFLLFQVNVSDHTVLMIVILAEGLIFNQILRIEGLACQLITKTKQISFLWLYTNAVLMAIFNTTFILFCSLLGDPAELYRGLAELNFYLIPLLALGNHLSNTKVAFHYTLFGIPLLRITLYFMSLSILFLLQGILQGSYIFIVSIVVFIIIYILTFPRQDSISLSYELYKIDIVRYDHD